MRSGGARTAALVVGIGLSVATTPVLETRTDHAARSGTTALVPGATTSLPIGVLVRCDNRRMEDNVIISVELSVVSDEPVVVDSGGDTGVGAPLAGSLTGAGSGDTAEAWIDEEGRARLDFQVDGRAQCDETCGLDLALHLSSPAPMPVSWNMAARAEWHEEDVACTITLAGR